MLPARSRGSDDRQYPVRRRRAQGLTQSREASSHRVSLFQGRKGLRLGHNDLFVMEAAPERRERGEDRQSGDHTQTHYLPPRTRTRTKTLSPPMKPHFTATLVTKLPQCRPSFSPKTRQP